MNTTRVILLYGQKILVAPENELVSIKINNGHWLSVRHNFSIEQVVEMLQMCNSQEQILYLANFFVNTI